MAELIERRRAGVREEHAIFSRMLMAARDRETRSPMTDKELIDEVLTLIVAGHETTASALTWTWYLISRAPARRRAALEAEADRTPTGPLGLDAAESLAFTHQVVQESLRLYPPGWLFTRRTLEDDELGGFRSRRAPMCSSARTCCTGTPNSGTNPRSSGRSALPASMPKERHRFAYIPFSVGPRHCIGENIAMFEMLVHLQTMMRRFRLTRVDEDPIELEAQINLRPRSKLMMTVEAR